MKRIKPNDLDSFKRRHHLKEWDEVSVVWMTIHKDKVPARNNDDVRNSRLTSRNQAAGCARLQIAPRDACELFDLPFDFLALSSFRIRLMLVYPYGHEIQRRNCGDTHHKSSSCGDRTFDGAACVPSSVWRKKASLQHGFWEQASGRSATSSTRISTGAPGKRQSPALLTWSRPERVVTSSASFVFV